MRYYIGVIIFFIIIIFIAAYFLDIPATEILSNIWYFIVDIFFTIKDEAMKLYQQMNNS